jgi:hypothetical protein
VLTGFRSGSAELALPGEPQPEYQSAVPLSRRWSSPGTWCTSSLSCDSSS